MTETTQETQVEAPVKKTAYGRMKARLAVMGAGLMVLLNAVSPASAAINLTSITADFVSVAGIIDASVTIFEALMGLVIALIPIVIAIAIAKFIPAMFHKILDMFKFGS